MHIYTCYYINNSYHKIENLKPCSVHIKSVVDRDIHCLLLGIM